jgi:hypothetical protein
MMTFTLLAEPTLLLLLMLAQLLTIVGREWSPIGKGENELSYRGMN